jgi:hypothetical protein
MVANININIIFSSISSTVKIKDKGREPLRKFLFYWALVCALPIQCFTTQGYQQKIDEKSTQLSSLSSLEKISTPYRSKDLLNMGQDFYSSSIKESNKNLHCFTTQTPLPSGANTIEKAQTFDGTPLDYHLYIPHRFFDESCKPFAVVFMVYGGGNFVKFTTDYFSKEYALTSMGCIVVAMKGERIPFEDRPDKNNDQNPTARINWINFPIRLFRDIKAITLHLKKGNLWPQEGKKPFPIIRPHAKMLLMGSSFGGYISALMATYPHYSQMFDGYICFNPVLDWDRDTRDNYQYPLIRKKNNDYDFLRKTINLKPQQSQYYFASDYLKDAAYNKKISPFHRFGYLKKPILIIQGIQDQIVSPKVAKDFMSTLRKSHKDELVRMHFVKTMGHFFESLMMSPQHQDVLKMMRHFVGDVIDGYERVGDHPIESLSPYARVKKDKKSQKEALAKINHQLSSFNHLAKRFKEKRAERLINGTHEQLSDRKGVFDQLIHQAWYDTGGMDEEQKILYNLINLDDKSIRNSQGKKLFNEYLKKIRIKKPALWFYLISDTPLSEQVRSELKNIIKKQFLKKEAKDQLKPIVIKNAEKIFEKLDSMPKKIMEGIGYHQSSLKKDLDILNKHLEPKEHISIVDVQQKFINRYQKEESIDEASQKCWVVYQKIISDFKKRLGINKKNKKSTFSFMM